jgi:hypothetical protein
MADGQAQEAPEASVESRLEAFFSPKAEAPVEEKPEIEAQQEEQTVEDEPTEEAAEGETPAEDSGLVEIEYEDGKTAKVPPELKEAHLRWKDYSQKTAQVSQLAKSAEDRLQFAEAREQAFGAVMQEVAEYKALQSQRAQFDNVDWGALYNADLGQAVKLRDQRDQLDKQLATMAQTIQSKTANIQQIQSQHYSKQWELAVSGAKQALGSYSQADDMAAAQWAQTRHFTEAELKGRFADARVLEAIHKAAKWDALQAGKPGAVAKAQAAPPVVKPGGSKGASVAAQSKYKDARQQLKRSGSVQDAARLFKMGMMK